eukprot:567844-Prymnesium_polylepis.1
MPRTALSRCCRASRRVRCVCPTSANWLCARKVLLVVVSCRVVEIDRGRVLGANCRAGAVCAPCGV